MEESSKSVANGGTIDEKIDHLAAAVKAGFDGVDERFDAMDGRLDKVEGRLGNVEGRLGNVEGRLTRIEATMVTKSYLDEKLGDLKGDLIAKMRTMDGKLEFVVDLLRAQSILSDEDLRRMHEEFRVFPRLEPTS